MTRLVRREVVLRGPEGALVLQVERVEGDVVPGALFRNVLALERLALLQPELHLVSLDEGSNLQRALAPREPPAAPPEPSEEPAGGGRRPFLLGVRVERLVLEDGRFTLRPSPEAEAPSLRLDGLEAEGELLLTAPTRTVNVQLRADGQLLAPKEGELSLRLSVEGSRGMYAGRLHFEATGAVPSEISLEARAEGDRFVLEKGALSLPGASLTVRGEGTPEQVELSGNIVATDLRELSRALGRVVGPERLPVRGRGRASFSLTGPMRNPTLSIDGRFPLLEYRQQTLRGVTVRLEIPNLVDWLSGEGEYAGEGEGRGGAGAGAGKGERGRRPTGQPRVRPALHLRPSMAPPLRVRHARAVLAQVRQRGPIRLEVEVEDIGLEELLRRLGLEVSLEGVTEADVKLSGSLENPRLDARVVVRQVLAEGLPPVDFVVRARTRPSGRLTLELTATALGQPSRVSLQLPYTLGQLLRQRPSREELLRAPITLEAELRDFPLPPSLLGVELGEVKLTELAQAPRLSGQVKVRGSLLRPEGRLALRLAGLGFEGEVPLVLSTDAELRPERTRVEARVAQREELLLRTGLQLEAPLARLLSKETRGEVALAGEVRLGPVAGERLEPVVRLLAPRILRVEGRVRADLKLAGRVDEPTVEGELEWGHGILETVGFGNYRDIHLLARGQGDRVVLEELVARSAGGAGRVTGQLEREEERLIFRARANLERFPFVYEDQLWANVSLEATARGSATEEVVDISPLRLDRALIELPSIRARELQELEPPENVVFVRNGRPVDVEREEAPAEVGEEDELRWRVALEAPRSIRVVGDELDVEVGLGEDFRLLREAGETEAFGRLFVRQGWLSFLGRRFELGEQSQVRFTGPVLEPELDVVATHVNRREDVTVTLEVEGRPGEVSTRLSSEPSLSETEILTLVATGRRQLTPGGGGELDVGAQAVSVLGGFLTRRLERTLGRTLPVDLLRIEPGTEGF
ncbi:MAG TPA: translocation/assembly module TamB domain-containing protein, partial [Myxococcaceae bacterium]|nr:translocation/assembly module TamB domain-containing protein [Myxococcaceae bacterium]